MGVNRELTAIVSTVRRNLHTIPEIGFDLCKTRQYLRTVFLEAGITLQDAAGGMFADVGSGSKTVLLRADMDALPIRDDKQVTYRSVHDNACHACGHDAHMAMLFGAALLLKEKNTGCRVRLMFQPAEECPPGGALGMIEAGILEGVDAAFALHVSPQVPNGMVGLKKGPLMAAADNFELMIQGRSGHGAMPHQAADAIVASAHVIVALQALVSRMTDPLDPLVVTVGKVAGGYAANVVADNVSLHGTARTLSEAHRRELPKQIADVAKHIAAAFGCNSELRYERGYPVLANDPQMIELAAEAVASVLGERQVFSIQKPDRKSVV